VNLDRAIGEVVALRVTAKDLYASYDTQPQDPTATSPVLPLDAPRTTGYLVALVVLRSLATEIALKAISYKRTQDYAQEHDLLLLHDALGDDIQHIIEQVGSEYGIASVRDTLQAHKDDFVNWRYLGEDRDRAEPDLVELDGVIGVLLDVFDKL
jgi:hypothetical protein